MLDTMPSEFELTISRYQTFLRDVLDPAIYPASVPVGASVYQIPDIRATPISAAEAMMREYRSVEVGWQWGPKWSTAWFRVTGSIPDSFTGQRTVLRFSSGTEGQVWKLCGEIWVPVQGLDVNRDSFPLFDIAPATAAIDVLIESACNHPFGILAFEWDSADTVNRWTGESPGRLERCEVAVFDPEAWELRHSYAFALDLLKTLSSPEGGGPSLPPDARIAMRSGRAQELYGALRRATNELHPYSATHTPARPELHARYVASRERAQRILTDTLTKGAAASATHCHAVGHAHIDTAWLWPIRETKRKCLRSFSNQLRLMERFPDYTFLCSQAQHYAWVEEQSPELFQEISQRVEEGRWEPGGAMWVEPDANCPSGESLVRQILHGTNYWKKKFGERGEQSFLYLPDTFGFPASLPQIMAGAGLKMFITNKMIWNRANVFPHTTFLWRGIDGTQVLAHNTPSHNYNATNTPRELHHGEVNHRNRDRGLPLLFVEGDDGEATTTISDDSQTAHWLAPFGFGDGGGGPTDWMIRYAELAHDCEQMPRVELGRVSEFIDCIEHQEASTTETPEGLPVWWGELYLEIHRGTLTTQAWIKAANRRAEEALRFAELLTFAGPPETKPDPKPTAHSSAHSLTLGVRWIPVEVLSKLDKAWKTLLLNQFHDILPGSSIGWVYEDAKRDFVRISKVADALIEKGTTAWLSGLSTVGVRKPLGVFNQCSANRSGVIELADGALAFARNVPAAGVAVVDHADPSGCVPAKIEEQPGADEGSGGVIVLSNGLVRVEIDEDGCISSLLREGTGREVVDAARYRIGKAYNPMNQLVLYEDIPHMWDAWDIDPSYEDKPYPVDDQPESIEIVSENPLRCAVRITRRLGAHSRIEQTYSLDAGSPRIDIHSKVDWKESRMLLRALFPTNILSTRATYDIQFGHISRPTHRNTSWDAAKFEVCAHRWMDLSEPGAGVAILNDGKYGHSCDKGVMGLTLLRSPKFPDPDADMGEHEFTYSVMPHEGDWRAAGVDREAEALNMPLIAYVLNPEEAGPRGKSWAPFTLETTGAGAVSIAAVKKAENDNRLILRVWESHGAHGELSIHWHLPIKHVEPVDLLERSFSEESLSSKGVSHEGAVTKVHIAPFQILTFAAS